MSERAYLSITSSCLKDSHKIEEACAVIQVISTYPVVLYISYQNQQMIQESTKGY